MNAILQAHSLGKRYGKRQALSDCTLELPPGHVVGLVGPNGAGKTTLLKIACGMLAPTTGRVEVLGNQPNGSPAQLARVGYVAQDTPTYAGLSVAENDTSVILSSHLVSDLERVCDYLVVLVSSRVHLAGETEELLAQHYRIVCTRRAESDLPNGLEVIWAEHSDRQSTFIVRSQTELPAGDWSAEHLELEDLVLSYMERAVEPGRHTTTITGDAR
jgi:ABC-type multidrug transport system ATPase subunit